MTVGELILEFFKLGKGDPAVWDMEVHLQGCDCYGEAGSVELYEAPGGKKRVDVMRVD